ncbi:GAF domain-containing protein [Vibrio fluvialis]|nr:GAF domain-containing protein [Vibrio fluvialis]
MSNKVEHIETKDAPSYKKLKQLSAENDLKNQKIISAFTVAANIWMTLVAPVTVGIFISHWYSLSENESLSGLAGFLTCVFLLTHIAAAIFLHWLTKKHQTHGQLTELYDQYDALVSKHNSLIKDANSLRDLRISQITALFLVSAELDKAIGEINARIISKIPKIQGPLTKSDMEGNRDFLSNVIKMHLDSMLWPLIVDKEELFGYKESSLFNIALYVYNPITERLEVLCRFNDPRIEVQNRSWKPGIGHVGMTFLHKEIKYCPNIEKSTELSVKSKEDEKTYHSFISVPILACEDIESSDNHPHGVLVLTSAHDEQFDLDRDFFFLHSIGKSLAVYLDKLDHSGLAQILLEHKTYEDM